jgi:YesN/AraC family two-component response regulator
MKKYLIIDDDALVRESIKLMLDEQTCQVDMAKNGSEGIDLYKQNHHDIIITDIIMPKKEGFETIGELKKLNEDVKIIAISGGSRNGMGTYLPIAQDLGAQAILYKPFDDNELFDTIENIS